MNFAHAFAAVQETEAFRWGRYFAAQAMLWSQRRALMRATRDAAAFLMDPFKNALLFKAEKTIVCGEREVCGAINRVLAERAFYNPGLFGRDIYFVGAIHPQTGWFAPSLIPQQTKAGISAPGSTEIESDYSCRVFGEEYDKLCVKEGVDYRCKDVFNLITASRMGLEDTGTNASENMKLAERLGVFQSHRLAVVSLPYAMFRNIGTLFKTWKDGGYGDFPCVSPHLLYPHALGITAKNWFTKRFVCRLVADEWKLSRLGGKYRKHFIPYEPRELNMNVRYCGEFVPKLNVPAPGK